MEDSRPLRTPMINRYKLSKEHDSAKVNEAFSRSMMCKIQNDVRSRPDIAHAIGIVKMFSSNPKETFDFCKENLFVNEDRIVMRILLKKRVELCSYLIILKYDWFLICF